MISVDAPALDRAQYVLELMEEAIGRSLPIDYGSRAAQPGRIAILADETLGVRDVVPGLPLPPSRALWDEQGRGTVAVGSLPAMDPPSGARVFWWTSEGNRATPAGWLADGGVVFRVDLIFGAFYFLSGWEEIAAGTPDRHGRYTAAQRRDVEITVSDAPVHFYVRMIRQALELLHEGRRWYAIARWPEGVPFVAGLSHDIDELKRLTHEHGITKDDIVHGISALRGGQVRAGTRTLARAAWHLATRRNPYWTFDQIRAIEQQAGARSSFYFLAGPEAPRPVHEPEMRALFRQLQSEDFEIGLHGGLEASRDAAQLTSERMQLQEAAATDIKGIRQHYLKLYRAGDAEGTWDHQSTAGLEYDSTLGYADREGFRAGWALPFHPWDFRRDRPHAVIEVPLIVMDGTLFSAPGGPTYRGLSVPNAAAALQRLVYRCHTWGAVLSVLWHNTAFCSLDLPDHQELYPNLLAHISAMGGTAMSLGSIVGWWRKRAQLCLSQEQDGRWRLEHRGLQPVAHVLIEASDGRHVRQALIKPGDVIEIDAETHRG